MLFKKKATKIVAIAAAVLLLLAAAVTGTVVALTDSKMEALAVGDTSSANKFYIESPNSSNLEYAFDAFGNYSFTTLLSTARKWKTFSATDTYVKGLEKDPESNKYTVYVDSAKASGTLSFYCVSMDLSLFDEPYFGFSDQSKVVSDFENGESMDHYVETSLENGKGIACKIDFVCKTENWGDDGKVTIVPNLKPVMHTVSFNAGSGYSVETCSDDQGSSATPVSKTNWSVKDGDSTYFKVTPTDSSKSVTVLNGPQTISANENAVYSIEAVNEDIQLTIELFDKTVSITYNYDGNGSNIDVIDAPSSASYGKSFTFQLSPKAGYSITVTATKGTKKEEIPVYPDGNRYTVAASDVTDNIEITVKAERTKYTIELSAPEGCYFTSMTGMAIHALTVQHGENADFKIVAENGYDVSNVTVTFQGNSVSKLGDEIAGYHYTLSSVTSSGTVTVKNVQRCYYNLTLNSVEGYTISTTDSASNLTWGQQFKFSVAVGTGYDPTKYEVELKSGETDLPSADEGGSYYTTANGNYTIIVKSNITVTLTVKDEDAHGGKLHYEVKDSNTAAEEQKGYTFTVAYDGEDSVAYHGKAVKITIKAKEGYRIEKVTINVGNGTVQPDVLGDVYTVNNVTAPLSVAVMVHENELSITYNGDGVSETTKVYKYSAVSGGSAVPESFSATYFDGAWKAGDVTVTNLATQYLDQLKNGDVNATLTASWTLKSNEFAKLLSFKVEQKEGTIGQEAGDATSKLWIHLSNDGNHDAANADGWTTFLNEISTRNGHVRALGFALAAIKDDNGHSGIESVESANQAKANYSQKILAGLSADNITSKSALAQCAAINCRDEGDQYVMAYGVCFDNGANWYNYTLTSTAEKLTRRAIGFWAAVEVNGTLQVIMGNFETAQSLVASSKTVMQAAMLPQASEEESDEEPTIE